VDLDQTKLGLLLQTMVATAVGGGVYLAASRLLGIGELAEIIAVVRARLARRIPPPGPA